MMAIGQPAVQRGRSLARARSDKSLARFDRIALVLSGGSALGAYQAGVYTALENCGVRPNWVAGTAIGAVNAAIIAGNLPHERIFRLRQFWQELSRRIAARSERGIRGKLGHWLAGSIPGHLPGRRDQGAARDRPGIRPGELRDLVEAAVDFGRVNS